MKKTIILALYLALAAGAWAKGAGVDEGVVGEAAQPVAQVKFRQNQPHPPLRRQQR